ncbi:sensor histidine kinase [Streptococcus cameli]
MRGSFRQALQKEIIRKSSLSAIYVTMILLLLLVLFSFFLQYSQLIKDTQQIAIQTQESVQDNKQLLTTLNQKMAKEFLLGKRTDREMFRYFYEKRAETDFESDLLIFDSLGEIRLTTNTFLEKNLVSDFYFHILLEKSSVEFVEPKVLITANRRHYLIFIQPMIDATEKIGYSALVVSDTDFIANDASFSAKYILTDQFGNIFAKNSSYFTTSSLEKLDNRRFAEQSIFSLKNPLITYYMPVGRNLSIYTFQPFVSIGFLAIFAVSATVILLCIYLFQMRSLTRKIISYNIAPIDSLVRQIKQISRNEITEVALKTGDEFEFMAEQINLMVKELDDLHTQKLILERERVFFERKMLEAQFNPHFLYNTLETIKITHELDGALTNRLIQNLTSILRYSISQVEERTCLGKDLSIVESYLEIHAIRFDGLSYRIECSDGLIQESIPKLFLLPLVENAIKYGGQYRIDLHIAITIRKENDILVFTVTDNAGALTKVARQKIISSLNSHHTQHGIVNSYRRLKEYFELVELDLGVSRLGETWLEFKVSGVKDV